MKSGTKLAVALVITGASIFGYYTWGTWCWQVAARASMWTPIYWSCGNWPLEPRYLSHPIGATAGEFQHYPGEGIPPSFHTGLDIRDDTPAPNGPYVLTKNEGTVWQMSVWEECVRDCGIDLLIDLDTNSHEHYGHLDYESIQQVNRDADMDPDPNTLPVAVGNRLPAHSRLGQLVDWFTADGGCEYHHLHFETLDASGFPEPLLSLYPKDTNNGLVLYKVGFIPNDDATAPGFVQYDPFDHKWWVKGLVDIVAPAYNGDSAGNKTGVLRIGYEVRATWLGSALLSSTIDFSRLGPDVDGRAPLLFRNSTSDYCFDPPGERYNYVLTNVRCGQGATCVTRLDDHDNAKFDKKFAWNTTQHPNGSYLVTVTAWDFTSKSTTRSELVRIQN